MKFQTLTIELKGEAEPVTVKTNARDWAQVDTAAAAHPLALMFQVAYFALMRIGHPIPRDFDDFLEVLEGVPEADEGASPFALDPTNAAPSEGLQ